MAETFITQCPHCSTSFRITDEHLAVANGSVRCGACLQVFSARNHLLKGNFKSKTNPTQPPAKTTPPQPERTATAKSEPDDDFSFEDDANDDFEDFIFTDDDDDLLSKDSDDDLDELSDAFRDLSDDAPARPAPAKPPAAKPTPSEPAEPSFNIDPDADDEMETAWVIDDEDDDDTEDDEADRESSSSQAVQLAQQISTPDFDFSAEAYASQRRWPSLLIIVLLLVTLAGELAWWQMDRYARLDPWRGFYQTACNVIGCELPPQQDLANVKPSNVLVRNHPTVAEVKLLDAILTNQAPFRQPFPTLILEYTDINGERVADQAFLPSDYLRGELTGIKLMPTNTRIYVSIPFRAPAAEAVNYQLRTAPGPG